MLDFAFASLALGELDQSGHTPVMICADSANASRSTTLQLTLKDSTDDIDFRSLLDVDNAALPLVLDDDAIGVL